MPNVREAEVSV